MKESDFPILKEKVHGKKLIYLDNAATSQKPKVVIDEITKYYETMNANTHRGIHTLAIKATEAFEKARNTVSVFFHAQPEEIIFTKGATESINIVAHGLKQILKHNDEIVITEMEHHSNIVPWQQIAKETGANIRVIPITKDYRLDMESANKIISSKTKIVSVTHMSNVLGTINPIKELAELAHKNNALILVDAAQSAPHMKINVKDFDIDFLVCSAHKMCGPTGVGVLYGKKELLENVTPFVFGGHMIKEVTFDSTTWNDVPYKFEGGTSNIEGVIAFGKAIEYLEKVNMGNIQFHEEELLTYALKELNAIKQVKIIGPLEIKNRGAVIAFDIEGIHPHDVSELLDRDGVAIRGGHHCCMPLHKKLGLAGTSRASFYFYNTTKDVDALVKSLKNVLQVFKL